MFLVGAVGSSGLHKSRKGYCFSTVCGDDPNSDWGLVSSFSKAHEHWKTTYICWNRECKIRLPAYGETIHGTDHYQKQQHLRRSGDPKALLKSGKSLSVILQFFALNFLWETTFTQSRWCLSVCMFHVPPTLAAYCYSSLFIQQMFTGCPPRL